MPSIQASGFSCETIGWPLILMDHISGEIASQSPAYATPEQDDHFSSQMAEIQAKLANIRTPRIGSIFEFSDGFDSDDLRSSKKLHDAIKHGDIDEVQKLLDKGTDPDAKDDINSTSLYLAVNKRNLEIVELLLDYGAYPNTKGYSGWRSLHYAAPNGDYRIVQLLLDHWADPNAQDDNGLTPLHFAVKSESVLVIKLLLNAGANINVKDKTGSTPLDYRTKDTPLDIARLLLRKKMGNCQPSTEPGPESFNTKYILIQSLTRLSQTDKQALDDALVKSIDYVSKNTYLCQYQDEDLQKIRKLEFIVYVDVYRTEYKTTPRLRELIDAEPDRDRTVDIIFHKSARSGSLDLQNNIRNRSHRNVNEIEFLATKARLTTRGLFLNKVASIDDVRCIESVGEVVMCNNIAREILKIDPNPPIKPLLYKGKGQKIAVADSGLDRGEKLPVHDTFKAPRTA
ncbi:MAG: hypothetical protein Q9167_004065 [Letrouitia subvulpina]